MFRQGSSSLKRQKMGSDNIHKITCQEGAVASFIGCVQKVITFDPSVRFRSYLKQIGQQTDLCSFLSFSGPQQRRSSQFNHNKTTTIATTQLLLLQ